MDIKLIEIFYDGDSFFFTQEAGERPKFNQIRCWTEFDGLGESVSQISVQIITAALTQAFGADVIHEQFDANDLLDGGPDEPSAFLGQPEECAKYVSGLLDYLDAHQLFRRKDAA